MTKKKENRGGAGRGQGSKSKYTVPFVTFNDRVPPDEVDRIREFIRDIKKNYLKSKNNL